MPRISICFFILICSTALLFAIPGNYPADLAEKYCSWLDIVEYIITPAEQKIFMQLTNERDRDAFISIFWKQRDPTNGTPENEFKDEHIKRFQYASRYFGFTSPLPGWKTDRGRIYILLGPPVSRNEIFKGDLYPIEIWDYYGGGKTGLPTMFHIVFFRKGGLGDFKLYVPSQDGPAALLVKDIDAYSDNDYSKIVNRIDEISPEVADIALSLIPGESTINYSPSMRDMFMLTHIYDLPKDNINTTYAANFLKFKSYVNVEDSVDFLSSRNQIVVLRDPILHMNFVHFAVWPKRISVDFSEEKDKYYCNYKLVVDVKQKGKSIFQYNKNLPFYYDKDNMETTLANGLIIADFFPVISGEFELDVFIQNAVNREFCFFEQKLYSAAIQADKWNFFGPLVSYRLKQEPNKNRVAFSLLNFQLSPDPQFIFGFQEPVSFFVGVDRGSDDAPIHAEIEVSSLSLTAPFSQTIPCQPLGPSPMQLFFGQLGRLTPGNYRLLAKIRDSHGIIHQSDETTFTISPMAKVPHPPIASPTMNSDKTFAFYGMLANQYENCGLPENAEQYYEKALAEAPANSTIILAYARFLSNHKKYDRLLEIIAPLQNQPQSAFEYFSQKGITLYQQGKYAEAVNSLLKANEHYDSDTSVLNALGIAFIRLNNSSEGRKALTASLKLNPRQPEITQVLDQLDKKK